MAASGFGLFGNNNAPMPIFGGTNPTGGNTSMFGSPISNMPVFSMFGGGETGSSPIFGPNFGAGGSGFNPLGTTSGVSSAPGSGVNMGSGFGLLPGGSQYTPSIYNELGKSYGKGFGQLLGNIFSQGLFNPEVAQQYINFMQPNVNRQEANLLGAFGSEGARFGSPAQIGLGDFLSQVNLNQGEIFANLYQQAQQEQLGLLENVLPQVAHQKANQGGWLSALSGLLPSIPNIISGVKSIGQSMGLGQSASPSIMDYAASVAPMMESGSAAGAMGAPGAGAAGNTSMNDIMSLLLAEGVNVGGF